MLFLNNLQPKKGSKKKFKRVGRGIGSGLGKTCGRGHKGQRSRSGHNLRRGFEGGQTPFYRRLPKFGFKSKKKKCKIVSLSRLDRIKDDVIDIKTLIRRKIVKNRNEKVKIVFGSISRPIKVHGIHLTKSSKLSINKLGGEYKDKLYDKKI